MTKPEEIANYLATNPIITIELAGMEKEAYLRLMIVVQSYLKQSALKQIKDVHLFLNEDRDNRAKAE